MQPLRRSTRQRRSPDSLRQEPKSGPTQPLLEKLDIWDSPLSKADQIAVHGYLPSGTQIAKRQSKRGAWVPVTGSRQSSEETLKTAKSTAKKQPAKRQPAPGPSAPVTTSRQSSEETLAAYDSDATITQSSPNTSRTVSEEPSTITSKHNDAALVLCMLHHAETRPLSFSALYTPFVEAREQNLGVWNLRFHGEIKGHSMPMVLWTCTKEGGWFKKEQEVWVKESAVREVIEREERRRGRLRAMLGAFEG